MAGLYGSIREAARDRLRGCVAGLDQFMVRFADVRTFPQGTVYLAPESSVDLDRLLAAVAHGFAEFGGVRADHVWHLSVARRGGEPLAGRFRASFRPIDALVRSVSIWTQEAPGGRWSLCHDAPLAGSASSSRSG
ncbi:2'-5' RNA ligase family protein [Microlunatus endophyticus]